MNMFNDVRENKKGFSLVELIVVIAIMAVMVAVLAPSLLQYVERSRAQKDDSAMSEAANAVQLALARQEVYDEVLAYAASTNYSCYVDAKDNTEPSDGKVVTDTAKGHYTFDDTKRVADEKQYKWAGKMRGVTITFVPSKGTTASSYTIADAIINKALIPNDSKPTGAKMGADVAVAGTPLSGAGTAPSGVAYFNGTPPKYSTAGTLSTMTNGVTTGALYNELRSAMGGKDAIEVSSQTYRNSEYTIFIRMGSSGGNSASAASGVQVYGQWSGTNLPSADPPRADPTPGT